jgi:hypothetical protein
LRVWRKVSQRPQQHGHDGAKRWAGCSTRVRSLRPWTRLFPRFLARVIRLGRMGPWLGVESCLVVAGTAQQAEQPGEPVGVREYRQPCAKVHADHPCSRGGDARCNSARPHAVWEASCPATPSWLLTPAPRRPGRRRRRPPQARPQLLGYDLDHRPVAAVLSGPGACWSRPTTTQLAPLMTNPASSGTA